MASRSEEKQSGHEGAISDSDMIASLCLLALLVAFALAGLAWDENWRKLLRVLTGFSAYIIVMLSALGAYRLKWKQCGSIPFWTFALAGAMAEVSSGWLRPTARTRVDLLTAIAAAFLIGGTHWLALRAWRPLRERILRAQRRRAAS
jgi:high-affinity Fe2+/Pb2+ permease